jgi:ascorbate-specific PTS system EIIC-type component UlaA
MSKKISKSGGGFWSRSVISIIIISIIGIGFVLWITFFYPIIEDDYPVWSLFLIFYVLIVAFWMSLFVGLFGFHEKSVKTATVMSIISAIIDIFYPPYAISINGDIISSESIGYKGSIDYTIGYYLNAAGIHGFMVFLLAYCIIPASTFFILMIILKPKQFINTLKNSI